MNGLFNRQTLKSSLLALGFLASVGLTGCQSSIGGQSLPSGHYLDDDVQYYSAGREFKHQREADAIRAANESLAKQQAGRAP